MRLYNIGRRYCRVAYWLLHTICYRLRQNWHSPLNQYIDLPVREEHANRVLGAESGSQNLLRNSHAPGRPRRAGRRF